MAGEQAVMVPPLAGDWRGQVGFRVESRWRGYGAVVSGQAEARVLECLARWRLLTRGQVFGLAGLGQNQEVLERLFRVGVLDRVEVMGVHAYTLSGYALKKMGLEWARWTALRALKVLAANRVGEVLVRALGGEWSVEPDRGRAALWEAGGQSYSVYVYRYWPGADGEILALLHAARGLTLVVVPAELDAHRLAGAVPGRADMRWTWDGAVEAGRRVRFWAWNGRGLVPAEEIFVAGA